MDILDIANEIGLEPKRTSSTKGGEYHCSCPSCGGRDRFIIWDKEERYWCRQCGKRGDAIQFCRDFLRLDYLQACSKVCVEPKQPTTAYSKVISKPKFHPQPVGLPPVAWQEKALQFVLQCHEDLLQSQEATQLLYDRGFTKGFIRTSTLGWNNSDKFVSLDNWGLPVAYKDDGKERKLWLPKGIVIPTMQDNHIVKLKIRRSDWNSEDQLPKYVEVSGSMKSPSLYGDVNIDVVVLVEAELDAMLIQQYASDLCCCIAIGGVGKKTDLNTDSILRGVSSILFALDFDEAGKKSFQFWRSTYQNLRPWPAPVGKSPGDALKLGIDLRKWIETGLQYIKRF